ncbi:Secreted effector protein PipB2 (Type III effector PipB2) [Durusdinium trenchii]|uniref:Secreted effector protein PipB2 (Type III effector PipB2) n=1 Tax=Durusdinium trenchii TaxID=1381693 RepID=A0ABP0HH82_9DINO
MPWFAGQKPTDAPDPAPPTGPSAGTAASSPRTAASSEWHRTLTVNFQVAEERRLKRQRQLQDCGSTLEMVGVDKSWLERELHALELQPETFAAREPEILEQQLEQSLKLLEKFIETKQSRDASAEFEWYETLNQMNSIIDRTQRPSLDAASLALAKLPGAKLAGASLVGADLSGADLAGAALGPGQGREAADLRGANLSEVQLTAACGLEAIFDGVLVEDALLYGAYLAKASFKGARMDCCNLEKVNFVEARFMHSVLTQSRCNGATFLGADLSHARMDGLFFAGGELEESLWEPSGPPSVGALFVEEEAYLAAPVLCRSKPQGGVLRQLVMLFFEDEGEEEEEDDEEEEEEEEGEEEKESPPSRENSEDPEVEDHGSSVPLLCAASDVVIEDIAVVAADQVEAKATKKLQAAVSKAEAQISKLVARADSIAKPQAEALQKLLTSKNFLKLSKLEPETVDKIAEVILQTKSGKKVSETLEKVQNHLQSIKESGVAPLLRNLADSQLKARTGYSSGQLLRIFRVSALQMARDTRELTKLQGYVEKLQETVNENNWDDVIASFSCFYALQMHLQGERSQQVFQLIWKDEDFRGWIQVAQLFVNVVPVNHPPPLIIHNVKKAVKHIKIHAETWEKAISKELAAIELTRTRQSQFFALLVSAISGFFMYIATFLSSVTFQAYQDGRLKIPYLSD